VNETPLRYRDAHGGLASTLVNDGKTLRVVLEGVPFEGQDFDGLEPVLRAGAALPPRFTLASGSLAACSLDVALPIPVGTSSGGFAATLEAPLALGAPAARGGIDGEALRLALEVEGERLTSAGKSGWFEDELVDLQRQLPEGAFLKTCFGCGLSDYSPYGHGLFGGLACFRTDKPAYRAVSSKDDLFRVLATGELVQETHLCPEFERRLPGTGYRG